MEEVDVRIKRSWYPSMKSPACPGRRRGGIARPGAQCAMCPAFMWFPRSRSIPRSVSKRPLRSSKATGPIFKDHAEKVRAAFEEAMKREGLSFDFHMIDARTPLIADDVIAFGRSADLLLASATNPE